MYQKESMGYNNIGKSSEGLPSIPLQTCREEFVNYAKHSEFFKARKTQTSNLTIAQQQ